MKEGAVLNRLSVKPFYLKIHPIGRVRGHC